MPFAGHAAKLDGPDGNIDNNEGELSDSAASRRCNEFVSDDLERQFCLAG